ncbi:MAG TPA: hypothetical protein GX730_08490 [Chloroflexi bacterium]|jgi:hypothetical protein|nr:hypothetical protein [Anaerolineaceae bacterium]HHX09447.1 hypothetical protein [Chloroflexota bacterium]
MKTEAIHKVNEKVYKKYIKLSGKQPKISSISPGSYLLQYRYADDLPNGKSISQTIRVVADEEGNISKISSSRG